MARIETSPFIEDTNALIEAEHTVWKEVLGTEVPVNRLPHFVTPDVRRNLATHGLRMFYLPPIGYPTTYDRKPSNNDRLLEGIINAYPSYIPGGLEENPDIRALYKLADKQRVEFPQRGGMWAAIEGFDAFSSEDAYEAKYVPPPREKLLLYESHYDLPLTRYDHPKAQLEDTDRADEARALKAKHTDLLRNVGIEEERAYWAVPSAFTWHLLNRRGLMPVGGAPEWTSTRVFTRVGQNVLKDFRYLTARAEQSNGALRTIYGSEYSIDRTGPVGLRSMLIFDAPEYY